MPRSYDVSSILWLPCISQMPSKQRVGVFVSCFEIYGPKCQDLLNNRERLEV